MNVMNEYLKINKKFITKYAKLMLGNKYNKKIAEEFLNTYVSNRYLLIDEELGKNNLKTEISKELDKLKTRLIAEDQTSKNIVHETRTYYNYLLYFDNVIHSKDMQKIIAQAVQKKEQISGKEYPELSNEIYEEIQNYNNQVNELKNRLKSKQFSLEVRKSTTSPYIKNVEINANIKFPILYSQFAIKKAMETEPIFEDMFFVEYHLIAEAVINDIINGDVRNQYIVKFPLEIMKKEQKKQRLLEILNNEFMKYKITFEINFNELESNKVKIYDLISQGYKFAVKIDDLDKLEQEDKRRLEIFKYVILNEGTSMEDYEIKSRIIEF